MNNTATAIDLDTIEDDEAESNVIALPDFIDEFGEDLLGAVKQQNPPIYDDNPDPLRTAIMEAMPRRPFDAQQRVVQAVTRLLVDEGCKASIINAEMGTGKTMMSIAVSAVMYNEGYKRTLVLSPPHLVYKWRREIMESVDNAKVWVLNGPDTLSKLLAMRQALGIEEHDGPEYFVLGRVRMRLDFNWVPALLKRKVHIKQAENITEASSRSFASTLEYVACVNCGGFKTDDEGNKISFHSYVMETRSKCQHCDSQMWSLVRTKRVKNKRDQVIDSLCQIPTIGKQTASKLVSIFSAESIEEMLSDNVYEFVNIMDEKGELVFNDRRAQRIERSMANLEFGFGQGGYQASEFIKRYLPNNYFGLLLVDEAHEYKNEGTAQGEAMGVLALKSGKVCCLTGTLMGGYATDLFYLLWRLLGSQMRDDGFLYNERGTLGSAAMSFMREYGVLKDIYKEVESTSHRTARGTKTTVRTSKAPGFSPKGIARYVLPYTVFLKLKDIGEGVLPDYREDLIDIDMSSDMASSYSDMSGALSERLRKALAGGDTTLLGVVINVLLRWPDTCFRPETVIHPRTGEVLFHQEAVVGDDELTPKEQAVVDYCKAQKARGRRTLVYSIYTGKQDITTRLKAVLSDNGLKTAVLRSTVSPDKREDWIMEQVDRGIDCLICNPELVKTGMDLYDFPALLFMQSGTNVYTVQQAARRSWRIGQTEDVEVAFMGYNESQQAHCLRLMAEKIAVSQSTSGDMPDSGLESLNSDSESIEVELAKQLAA